MTDKIVILVTAGNMRESRKIARQLVESHLAACVNITQPIRSIYRWKGKVADDRELLLIIKTTQALFKEAKASILSNHSYTTPEIISLPIVDGSPDYLQWIEDSVKKQ